MTLTYIFMCAARCFQGRRVCGMFVFMFSRYNVTAQISRLNLNMSPCHGGVKNPNFPRTCICILSTRTLSLCRL